MKRKGINIILVIVFFVGLSVVLYPLISSAWNSHTQSRAVASYNSAVARMPQEDYSEMFEAAEAYNRQLMEISVPFVNYDQIEGYDQLLDVSGTGIMGYVTIEKIRVELPIYHGTDSAVLQIAAGHLQGSSLPTGGAGTHCVISAHRGFPSARLFTRLDEMEIGDIFTVTVLDRTMTYEVDQILVVEPQEIEALQIDPQEDYVTLMTCTPYGINSHRLLVRGVRTADVGADYVPDEVNPVSAGMVGVMAAILALIFLGVLLIRRFVKPGKAGRRKE